MLQIPLIEYLSLSNENKKKQVSDYSRFVHPSSAKFNYQPGYSVNTHWNTPQPTSNVMRKCHVKLSIIQQMVTLG